MKTVEIKQSNYDELLITLFDVASASCRIDEYNKLMDLYDTLYGASELRVLTDDVYDILHSVDK